MKISSFVCNFLSQVSLINVGVEELPLVAGAICCANYFPASQWTGNCLCGKGIKIWYFIISKTSQPRQQTRCALVYCSDEDEAICGTIRFRVGENPYRNFITECKWGSGVAKVPIINRFHTKSTTIQRKWYRKHPPHHILPSEPQHLDNVEANLGKLLLGIINKHCFSPSYCSSCSYRCGMAKWNESYSDTIMNEISWLRPRIGCSGKTKRLSCCFFSFASFLARSWP